jgi:hypothetical protein
MRTRFSYGAAFGLIGILALGAVLRFHGIRSKGLFFWDEGMHMMAAQYLHSMASGLRERGEGLIPSGVELDRVRAHLRGHHPETAKPMHIALIAASMAVLGDHDYCGNLVSALCGTLTIAVVFLLGMHMGGTPLGLAGAFLLAISPLHVIYSRETLAEADSIFFFYCGLLLWSLSCEGRPGRRLLIFGAGALSGISLTCNDRWVIIPLILASLEAAALAKAPVRRPGRCAARCAVLAAGFLLPLLLWEGAYAVVKYRLGLVPMDYYDQFMARTTYHARFSVGYGQMLPFFHILARFEGVAVTALLLAGIVLLCVRRTRADAALLIVLFFPFALFTFRPHHFLRIFSLAVPCICLIAASFACWAGDRAGARGTPSRRVAGLVTLAILALAAAPNLARDARVLAWRSFHRQAAEFLNARRAPYYSTCAKLSQYYSGVSAVTPPPRGEGAARVRVDPRKTPYLLADKQRFYQTTFGPSPSEWVREAETKCPAVFERQEWYDMLFFDYFAFEHNMDYRETSEFLKGVRLPEAAMLRVYRLADYR